MRSSFSESALRALGVFGLTTDDAHAESSSRAHAAQCRASAIDQSLRPGQLALITGPSASGKSSILQALAESLRPDCLVRGGAAPALAARVIDALAPSAAELPLALRSLSAAGLADAFIPARPIGALSAGESARLAIAHAVMRAESLVAQCRSPTIILDDFADALDDATAIAVSHALRRWLARHPRSRIVIATVRPHVAHALRPDLRLDLGTPTLPGERPLLPSASDHATSDHPEPIIYTGTPADYQTLAHFHYRAARPATIARILVARATGGREPIGVLVVSMPTLNAAWRTLAWPGAYADTGRHGPLAASARSPHRKRALAHAINRDLRCLSRLIVHPLHRARGVASALLRTYLAAPLTRRTECPSAMGVASPVFLRAGMREWTLPPARRDLALLDALRAADLATWMLADIDLALDRIAAHPHLDRSLRIWANAHGPTRPLAGAPARVLIRAAAKHIIAPRRAYTASEPPDECPRPATSAPRAAGE